MTNTVAQALARARTLGVERLDAQLLLAAALQQSRAWLLAHDDAVLTAAHSSLFADMLARRAAGEPLAYILGEKEFHGLRLRVGPGTLVPRPDTETLVDWALDVLGEHLQQIESPQVVDLGTGSGAIALAVKSACPRVELTAVDTDDAALGVARANGRRLRLEVNWQHGHWWDAVGPQHFDLALSNPPYIAENDPHLSALAHEPRIALASGPHGLDALREIIAGAPARLRPGAWLLLEHGHDQAAAVCALLAAAGFLAIESRPDLSGILRCSGGRLAASG